MEKRNKVFQVHLSVGLEPLVRCWESMEKIYRGKKAGSKDYTLQPLHACQVLAPIHPTQPTMYLPFILITITSTRPPHLIFPSNPFIHPLLLLPLIYWLLPVPQPSHLPTTTTSLHPPVSHLSTPTISAYYFSHISSSPLLTTYPPHPHLSHSRKSNHLLYNTSANQQMRLLLSITFTYSTLLPPPNILAQYLSPSSSCCLFLSEVVAC